MPDDTDVLLKLYEVQFSYLKQLEDQRAQITNMLLLITSVVIGFIAQKGPELDTLPLTILLIVLGTYGAIISEKLYERFGFFRERIDAVERKLEKLHPGAEIIKLWQEANQMNAKAFPRLNKVRLHRLWLLLHLGIAAAGVILTVYIFVAHPA